MQIYDLKNKIMITVKDIFANIQGLNPSTSVISSIGSFVSSQNQQLADSMHREVMRNISDTNSLAYKIACDANKFTDKQLWIIAYELLKNVDYCENLEKEIKERHEREESKRVRKAAKRSVKKEMKVKTDAEIKINTQTNDTLTEGKRVAHTSFGEGVVITEDTENITVIFDGVGEKKMLKKYVKLQEIK